MPGKPVRYVALSHTTTITARPAPVPYEQGATIVTRRHRRRGEGRAREARERRTPCRLAASAVIETLEEAGFTDAK